MTESGSPLPLLSRYAIMVDVGYIYASAGELLFSAASRREYRVDADKLIQALTRLAAKLGRIGVVTTGIVDVIVDEQSTLFFKPALEITTDAIAAYDKAYPAK